MANTACLVPFHEYPLPSASQPPRPLLIMACRIMRRASYISASRMHPYSWTSPLCVYTPKKPNPAPSVGSPDAPEITESDKDCPWSLYHPLSLYRNGYAIVHSDEGNLLLQSTFMQAKTAEGRMKLTMRVNVQQLDSSPFAEVVNPERRLGWVLAASGIGKLGTLYDSCVGEVILRGVD
ncbi:hypothetical protein C8F01DRAFT_1254753 [Mycena amicta]|nr:hypothetical protein C8F01DRAFT_1254753 [Mycena amicta]